LRVWIAVVVSVMTLASFIKVIASVFFGQASEECRQVKEVPFSMRLPMYIMSALCVISGIFYDSVEKYLLRPAANALLNVTSYIDAMLGQGYAASAGITNMSAHTVEFNCWDPMVWLILFVVIMAAVLLVIMLGRGSQKLHSTAAEEVPDKYAPFFGGEKSVPSHAGGSDLFWGFKHDFKGYFRFMDHMHSGKVGDYALWVVVATALVILFAFIFV